MHCDNQSFNKVIEGKVCNFVSVEIGLWSLGIASLVIGLWLGNFEDVGRVAQKDVIGDTEFAIILDGSLFL